MQNHECLHVLARVRATRTCSCAHCRPPHRRTASTEHHTTRSMRRCSAHAYVSGGAWIDDVRNSSHWLPTCTFASKARYICKEKQQAWKWRPSAHCADPPPLTDLFAGRTLFVMGDSMQFEIFLEIGCRLQREGARMVQMSRPKWAWQTNLPDKANGRVHLCATFEPNSSALHSRLCFVPVGTTGRYVPEGRDKGTVATALTYMVGVNATRATDVVLANEGAWLKDVQLRDRTEALRRAVISGSPANSRHTSLWPLVVWRESYAQHFPTSTGAYNATREWEAAELKTSGEVHMACSHIPAPALKPQSLSNVTHTLSHLDGGEDSKSADGTASRARDVAHPVVLIDGWSLTRDLPLAHPGHVALPASAHNGSNTTTGPAPRSGFLDCTHICTFNGINEAIIDALSSHLSHTSVNSTLETPAERPS